MSRRPGDGDVAASRAHPRGIPRRPAAAARYQFAAARRAGARHHRGAQEPRSGVGRSMKRALLVTAFFVGLILLWKAATVSMGWSPLLLPPPEAVARYLWDALLDGTLLSASLVTV